MVTEEKKDLTDLLSLEPYSHPEESVHESFEQNTQEKENGIFIEEPMEDSLPIEEPMEDSSKIEEPMEASINEEEKLGNISGGENQQELEVTFEAPLGVSSDGMPETLTFDKEMSMQLEKTKQVASENFLTPRIERTSEKIFSQISQNALSEQNAAGQITATDYFNVYIEGILPEYEKNKLLSLLSRENFGIRELDIETQLSVGKLLLPQLTEFALVLVVQCIRSAPVKIKITRPSNNDTTQNIENNTLEFDQKPAFIFDQNESIQHPSQNIPILNDRFADYQVYKKVKHISTLTCSGVLHCKQVHLEGSEEFIHLVEALQTEMKFKAFHQNSNLVLGYNLQIDRLELPTYYRITLTGIACTDKLT